MNDLSELTGKLLAGRYLLGKPLGRGAFGRTFIARDQASERDVAVKLLDPRGTADWKAFDLFEREAAVLRSLRHHAIPEVFELLREGGSTGSSIFLVMEYVEGVSLEGIIQEGRVLDPVQTLHLFLEMLGVLEYLHARVPPVLHRDIKPANVIVRPNGLPALVDFGSVRNVIEPEEGGSTVAGTYGYMPYEQYMGQATPASDLYALGATFLHLLTGRAPRVFMNAEGRIEVPDSLPGDARFAPLIARMLRPSPPERFQSAAEVRSVLLAEVPSPQRSNLTAPTAAQPNADRAASRLHLRARGDSDSDAGEIAQLRRSLGPNVRSAEVQSLRDMLAGSRVPKSRRVASHAALALAAPRRLEGATAELLDQLAPSMWQFMGGSEKQPERATAFDILSLVFFSVITAGTLPLVFLNVARARRRRLKRFVSEGVPGVAQIVSTRLQDLAFGVKIAQVSYEFEGDGELHRDVDQVLPVIADRWRVGDVVEILYLPERDFDSVIVSTT